MYNLVIKFKEELRYVKFQFLDEGELLRFLETVYREEGRS